MRFFLNTLLVEVDHRTTNFFGRCFLLPGCTITIYFISLFELTTSPRIPPCSKEDHRTTGKSAFFYTVLAELDHRTTNFFGRSLLLPGCTYHHLFLLFTTHQKPYKRSLFQGGPQDHRPIRFFFKYTLLNWTTGPQTFLEEVYSCQVAPTTIYFSYLQLTRSPTKDLCFKEDHRTTGQ